MINNVT